MGLSLRLKMVTNALTAEGIAVERGYPNRKLRLPQRPVAAVAVERADHKETVLAIWICGPAAVDCEDTAQVAALAIRQTAAFCQVEACRFDEKSGLFSVKIQALWKEAVSKRVKLNRDILVYATDFSAVQTRQVQQVADEETGQVRVVNEEVVWTIAVQEQLPFPHVIEVEDKEAFTLTVMHENYVETYPECYWLSITLEENGAGLLRKRIARSWTERTVEFEDEQT